MSDTSRHITIDETVAQANAIAQSLVTEQGRPFQVFTVFRAITSSYFHAFVAVLIWELRESIYDEILDDLSTS